MKFSKSISILSFCFLLVCASAAQAGYIDNHDGTVTDNGTGLMWQQATAPGSYHWEQALAYCETLALAGQSDWRLPTVKELSSLASSIQENPLIKNTYFPSTGDGGYWSSTTSATDASSAWFVILKNGLVHYLSKGLPYSVRAVRGGQTAFFDNSTLWPVPDTGQTLCYDDYGSITCPQPSQSFYGQDAQYTINTPIYTKLAAGGIPLPDNATTWAMVRDEVTGLVWEEKHNKDTVQNYEDPNDADNTYTWYDSYPLTNGGSAGTPGVGTDTEDFRNALNFANYGGYADWRMPTAQELQSIVDYGRCIPAINTTYFPNGVGGYYWSSTTYANLTDWAWSVFFRYGNVTYASLKSSYYHARAVRGGQTGVFPPTTTTTTSYTHVYYYDSDGDTYGNAALITEATSQPPGYVTNSSDCDDFNAAVHPGAREVCNGIDDNCDGATDDLSYPDVITECGVGACHSEITISCVDGIETHCQPGEPSPEVCDGIDNDCDGSTDEGCGTSTTTTSCPIPVLTAPNATGGPYTPLPAFTWNQISSEAWYNVAVWDGVKGSSSNIWVGPTACTSGICTAQFPNGVSPGTNWWWLNIYYGENACGFREQPGGVVNQFTVAGCAPPALTSPSGGQHITAGQKPTFIFQKTAAEWINIQAWSSTGYLSLDVWQDAATICPEIGTECSWPSTKAFQPGTTNWWWLNTYSAACGFLMQPGGNVNSFYQN